MTGIARGPARPNSKTNWTANNKEQEIVGLGSKLDVFLFACLCVSVYQADVQQVERATDLARLRSIIRLQKELQVRGHADPSLTHTLWVSSPFLSLFLSLMNSHTRAHPYTNLFHISSVGRPSRSAPTLAPFFLFFFFFVFSPFIFVLWVHSSCIIVSLPLFTSHTWTLSPVLAPLSARSRARAATS